MSKRMQEMAARIVKAHLRKSASDPVSMLTTLEVGDAIEITYKMRGATADSLKRLKTEVLGKKQTPHGPTVLVRTSSKKVMQAWGGAKLEVPLGSGIKPTVYFNTGTKEFPVAEIRLLGKAQKSAAGEELPADVQKFTHAIGGIIRKHFPKGYTEVRADSRFGSSGIYVATATKPANEQKNGIIQNDPAYQTFWMHGSFTDAGMNPKIKIEMSQGSKVYGWRNKSGSPEQILKYLDAYYARLSTMMQAREVTGARNPFGEAPPGGFRPEDSVPASPAQKSLDLNPGDIWINNSRPRVDIYVWHGSSWKNVAASVFMLKQRSLTIYVPQVTTVPAPDFTAKFVNKHATALLKKYLPHLLRGNPQIFVGAAPKGYNRVASVQRTED